MGCLHGTGARDGRCRSWRQPPLSCSMLPKGDRMEAGAATSPAPRHGQSIQSPPGGRHRHRGPCHHWDGSISRPSYQWRDSHYKDKTISRPFPWSWDCLIFIMGIPILVRQHLSIETLPCAPWPSTTWPGYCWGQAIHRHCMNRPDWQTALPARIANPCSLKSLIITFRQKSWRYL